VSARSLYGWALETEGSTRSAALIRIGLAAILWANWGRDLTLLHQSTPCGAALSLTFFGSTALMLIGFWTRPATLVAAAVAFTLYFASEALGFRPWFHHNSYLVSFATFLCALTPCDRSYSLDRWLALRRARREDRPPPAERGNLWALRLIACQLSLMYFWSAYDKSSLGFLSGERMEFMSLWFYFGSNHTNWPGFGLAMAAISIGSVALEYALAAGMLFPRTRGWLTLPGMLMHGFFYLLLPISTFTVTVWCLYLAYFDADAVHRVIDDLSGVPRT
jgi:hypothetical protein